MEPGSPQGQSHSPTRHLKKSSFVAQLDLQRNARIMGHSRKQLSHSTFLGQQPPPIPRKYHASPTDLLPRHEEELSRARSLKSILNKPIPQAADKTTANDLTDNMVRLKVEEMTFKFKTRISCMLKELGVSGVELGRFSGLSRIDDMLTFLSERLRERVTSSQLSEASFLKVHLREKETVNSHEVELEMLRRRLQEREGSERQLKGKLRQAHNESRSLFQQINQKEKELSAKVTEAYQQKVTIKEQQKMIEHLQGRCESLQKHEREIAEQATADSKEIIGSYKELQEENSGLGQEVQELRQQVERGEERVRGLEQSNRQMRQELYRWRQRFQDSRSSENEHSKQKSWQGQNNQEIMLPTRLLKKSTMSMSNCYLQSVDRGGSGRFSVTAIELENMKLSMRVEELQKQNKQLSRDILNYATVKQRYEHTVATVGDSGDTSLLQGVGSFKEGEVDLGRIELEGQYKKKLEDVAGEWKNKLYEIVYKYEDELDALRLEMSLLTSDKELLEKKLFTLANDKYEVENKLIEKEKELYLSGRESKSPSTISHPNDHHIQSDFLLSAAEIITKGTQPYPVEGKGAPREQDSFGSEA